MKKNIRKATSNDIEAAKRIFGEARAYMRRNGNSVQWVNGYPEKLIESDIDKSILYICEAEDGTALAVFALIVGEEDPCYGYIENGAWKNDLPYAVIHRAAVSEAARGTGAAKYIFNEVYKKYGNVRVDTHESNTPMRSFLTNLGYDECGIVYMEDNTPRVAYQKTASWILASASPRRRELMLRLGRPFVSETSNVEEIIPEGLPAEETAQYLSGIKAEDIFMKHKDENVTVIGSDTIVIENGRIYGKPHSKKEAFDMLKELSGKTHEVRTGVTILSGIGGKEPEKRISFTNTAEVEFYELSDDEVNAYIETGEPMDKAGAYGIQGQGALFIKGIKGDYYTIMGFPISQINREVKNHNL